MKSKKAFTAVLAVILAFALLASCGGGSQPSSSSAQQTPETTPDSTPRQPQTPAAYDDDDDDDDYYDDDDDDYYYDDDDDYYDDDDDYYYDDDDDYYDDDDDYYDDDDDYYDDIMSIITGPSNGNNNQGGAQQVRSRLDENLPFMPFPYSFTLTDLNGNPINESSLGNKRLFFVHFWGTWCGPCIDEMPDLAQVARDYGDTVGFLGLLDDFDSNPRAAIQIKESSGIPRSFITVDAHSRDMSALLNMVRTGYVPSTVILDGRGNIIGEALIGAFGPGYADVIDEILDHYS